ncbi:DUF4442 domain-containing protein [Myxococcota bacterium]|nr:DUF4442 domain-containing protein [Myxococcota bacterium]
MQTPNKLSRTINVFKPLPAPLRKRAQSKAMGFVVPFLNTAGLCFDVMTNNEVEVSIANKRKVRNHIGGVHAAAVALLAETASGFVFGLNVPDDKLPLVKSMNIDFTKRSHGAMRAVATLPEDDIARIINDDKGSVTVRTVVTDATGNHPVQCEMVWAWVPKSRK